MNITNAGMAGIFLLYGLAFFSMGLAVLLEGGRGSDLRLRLALRPLAVFGLLHGIHEWLELFEYTQVFSQDILVGWDSLKLCLLAFSFLSLGGFGFSSLAPNIRLRRISLLGPLLLCAIWGFGLLNFRGQYTGEDLLHIADVWTRYTLGIPTALSAAAGLVAQQRAFRKAGMAEFGRDSLIAAIAFGWYGLVGQLFTLPSRIPPSTYLNQDAFLYWFGFPVQALRAGLAILITVYVIRFMRAFDIEINRQMNELREARLLEAQRRETMRGQLLQRVVAAQEAERIRIARELHDETGQALTALGLGLRGVTESLTSQPELTRQNLRQLEALSSHSLTELQRFISNLRPSHLDDLGLPAALRWYLGETRQHAPQLDIQFDLCGQERPLPDAVKTAIFRIVQEALTNVIKHAQADKVFVQLCYQPEQVEILIQDDGVGLDLERLKKEGRQSWGLLGMQERAALLNGQFEIVSSPGQGFQAQIAIPTPPTGVTTHALHEDDQIIVG